MSLSIVLNLITKQQKEIERSNNGFRLLRNSLDKWELKKDVKLQRVIDTVLSYIEELESNKIETISKDFHNVLDKKINETNLENKIRDKIKELEEDKQTILQTIENGKENKDKEFLKYNREILYRINGEISVLKSIIGE